MSTTRTTNVRNGGRWLLAAAVVFVAGYALVVLVEPGGLATELGVAVPLVAAAVLLVIGTATAAAASPVRPPAVGAVIAAVGCALGVTGLVTASMLAELAKLGGLDVEGLYIPVATVTTALGGAAVAALAVALRGVAGRTGAVLAVLGVVVVLGCLLLDPIVPFVLAGVLGVALARLGASATM
jgi:hypothetical protein